MTILQLEYLIAVDTHKSFADAAQKSFVTQPALSMQVKKIEDELGILIFDRAKKPIATTELGKRILEQARETVWQARKIYEIVQAEREEMVGELRIGIIPTLSPYLLPRLVANFSLRYPEVRLVIRELFTDQIETLLSTDALDVGLLASPLFNDQLVERPLFYEPFVVYLHPAHALAQLPFIETKLLNINEMWLLHEGHCFRNQVVSICADGQEGAASTVRFEGGSLETIKRLVEAQPSYTLLPQLAVAGGLPTESIAAVRPLAAPAPVREISLVTHQRFMKERLINTLQKQIIENVPPEMLHVKGSNVIGIKNKKIIL